MDEIKEQCYQLELLGIKPSIVLCGKNIIDEIILYTNHNVRSAFWIDNLFVNGHKLDVIRVDDENMSEVYGNKIIALEEKK